MIYVCKGVGGGCSTGPCLYNDTLKIGHTVTYLGCPHGGVRPSPDWQALRSYTVESILQWVIKDADFRNANLGIGNEESGLAEDSEQIKEIKALLEALQ